LISEHLVAVNPYGLQAKKPDCHMSMSTVKSRNNQIWIFLFEGFNLAHSSSPSTFKIFGTPILAAKCSQFQFWPTLRPIEKNIHAFFGPGPMGDVYLNFRLPWPAQIAAGILTPEKWRPFEIYLTTTWTAPYLITHILAQYQPEWFLHKNLV
jgi:hypothetical protein